MSGCVVWITGLPAAGKSTLATKLRDRLVAGGIATCIVDSDAVRTALVPRPGYTDSERDRFYATLANLAAMLAKQGLIVLVPATAHRRAYRERARRVAPAFVEVHIAADRAECEKRDIKQLYQQNLSALPGAGVTYEAPEQPDVTATGGHDERALQEIATLFLG